MALLEDVRNGKTFRSKEVVKTRPATRADIRVGRRVFCLFRERPTPGGAAAFWKELYWQDTAVSDVSDMDRDLFKAPFYDFPDKARVTNARVAVE